MTTTITPPLDDALIAQRLVQTIEPSPYSYGPNCSYDDILRAISFEVVDERSVGSYQGDTFAIVRVDEAYGYVEFAWGSCSGCDALQACDSVDDVISLAQSLNAGTLWCASAADLYALLSQRDWETQWGWHDEECKEAIVGLIASLRDHIEAQGVPVASDGREITARHQDKRNTDWLVAIS